MKSNLRNEIKSYIVRQGMTMQEVVDLLSDEYGWSDSVSNLSNKLQRESLRYPRYADLFCAPFCYIDKPVVSRKRTCSHIVCKNHRRTQFLRRPANCHNDIVISALRINGWDRIAFLRCFFELFQIICQHKESPPVLYTRVYQKYKLFFSISQAIFT